MPGTNKPRYRQFAFQSQGRAFGLTLELLQNKNVQVGVSMVLSDDAEIVTSGMIDVVLVSRQGRHYNCSWREPRRVLPVFRSGGSAQAMAGFRFTPLAQRDVPKSVTVVFNGKSFEFEFADRRYRMHPKPPTLPHGLSRTLDGVKI